MINEKKSTQLIKNTSDASSAVFGFLGDFLTGVPHCTQFKNRPLLDRQALCLLLPFILRSDLSAGRRSRRRQSESIRRLASRQRAIAFHVVPLSMQVAILIDQLVRSNLRKVAHQMCWRFHLSNLVQVAKHGPPHRLHTVFGAIQHTQLLAPEASLDGSDNVRSVARHQLFCRCLVMLLEAFQQILEVVR